MKRISRQYDQSLNPIYLVACIYSYVAQTWYEPLVSVSGSCNRTSTSSSSRLSIKSDDLTVITFLALPSILTSNTIRAAGRNSWERKQEMPLSYITCTWCMAHTRNMDLLPFISYEGDMYNFMWKMWTKLWYYQHIHEPRYGLRGAKYILYIQCVDDERIPIKWNSGLAVLFCLVCTVQYKSQGCVPIM